METRLDDLECKLIKSDAMCDEWMAYIQLWGMVWQSKIAGEILGITGAAEGKDMSDWSDADKKKQNGLWAHIGNKAAISLHYIPEINSWSIEVGGQTRLLTRRMIGYRKNQCLYKLDLIEHKGESLAIAIYERSVRDEKNKQDHKRLAFCLMHENGFDLQNEKDHVFVVAEYPLPGSIRYWSKLSSGGMEGYDVQREELGWKEQEREVGDSYKDYFGEYDHAEHPNTYSNRGVTVTPWIG